MSEKFEGGTPPKRQPGRPPKKKQRLEPVPNITIRGGLNDFNRGMVTALTHVGYSPSDIATLTHVSRASVYNQLQDIEAGRPYGSGSTPQGKESPEHVVERREIVAELHKEDVSRNSNDIRRILFKDHEIDVSHRTVVRDQVAMGGRHLTKIVVQKLNEGQAEKRLLFSTQQLKKKESDEFWSSLVFTDETYRGCTDMDQTQWVYDGEERGRIEKTRWDSKIHIWGYIGVGIRGLHLIEERSVTGESYLERLKQTLGKASWKHNRTWQQDNARPHVAKPVMEWFAKNNIAVLPWPANSPDLSPIENLWARLWREAMATHPENNEELWKRCKEVFYGFPQSYIDGLVLSFRRRLEKCKDENGESISEWY